ncbi:unhealthy ribosome biogenesis protein 2 homolog isoform X2 [Ptychodera flava]|uniref:unhealthy ribosome biogenesis protein 2 homolog isoform X2 n=1 Tax=Ptychodera flava TaxID=63121 RepID=UPI003969C3ED
MAACVSGVHKILKDKETSWSEKIQVANIAWKSDQCYIPNKQQVLAEWVSNTLISAGKFDLQDDIKVELWKYLHLLLQSKSCEGTRNKQVTLKTELTQVFIDELKSNDDNIGNKLCLEEIIRCCLAVLSSPNLVIILTANFQKFVEFAVSVVMLANSLLRDSESTLCDVDVLLENTLKVLSVVQRQQANQRPVFSAVCYKLLLPWLELHQGLHSSQWSNRENLMKNVVNLITNGLFHRDLLEAFSRYLYGKQSDKTSSSMKTDLDAIDKFLKYLQDKIKSDEKSNVVYYGIPLIYHVFLSLPRSFSESKDFTMFYKLCVVIGLTPELMEQQTIEQSIRWDSLLNTTMKLLELRVQYNLYSATDDEHQGLKQFKWYQQLFQFLLKHPQRQLPSWFKCLQILLELNHKILDGKLSVVWEKILEIQQLESDVQTAYDSFVRTLVQTYTKLHQFDRLFRNLLQAMRLQENLSAFSSIWKTVQCRFFDGVSKLSPKLMLDLWEALITEMSTHYLPRINSTKTETPPRKKFKNSGKSCEKLAGECLVTQQLETIACIFHGLVQYVNLFEGFTPLVSSKLNALMNQMQDTTLIPLIKMCYQGNQVASSLMRSCLMLFHCYGQLKLLLNCHTMDEKTGTTFCSSLGRGLPYWDFSYVFTFVSGKQWRAVSEAIDKNDATLKYLMELLNVQKLRALVVFGSVFCRDVEQSISNVLEYVCSLPNGVTQQEYLAPWDGQLPVTCYPVSHWYVICSHITLLLPHCKATQTSQIASYLVKTLCHHHNGNRQQQKTLYTVSRDLLRSEDFQESVDLQVSIVTELFQEIKNVLKRNSLGPKWVKLISLLVSKEISWLQQAHTRPRLKTEELENVGSEDSDDEAEKDPQSTKTLELNESWQQIKDIACEIHELNETVELPQGQIQMVDVEILQDISWILSELKLEYLILSNQTRCILGLIILQQLLHSTIPQDLLQIAPLATSYSNLLCRLLQGVPRNVVFDFLDSGILLMFLTGSVSSSVLQVDGSDETCEVIGTYKSSYYNLISTILRYVYRVYNWSIQLDQFILKLQTSLQEVNTNLKRTQEVRPILSTAAVILQDLTMISENSGDKVNEPLKRHHESLSKALLIALQSLKVKLLSTNSMPEVLKVATVAVQGRLFWSGEVLTEAEWKIFEPLVSQVMTLFNKQDSIIKMFSLQYLEFLTVICKAYNIFKGFLRSDFLKIVWQFIMSLREHEDDSAKTKMQLKIVESAKSVLKHLSNEDLSRLLHTALQNIEKCEKNSLMSVMWTLTIILEAQLPRYNFITVTDMIPNLTVALVTVMVDICGEEEELTVSLLKLLQLFLVKRLVDSKMVLLILHGCISVSQSGMVADQNLPVFNALCDVLNAMLIHDTKVVLNALPSYTTCISQLLSWITHQCRELDISERKTATNTVERFGECVQKVERLISTLSTHKVEVCKVAPYLVAEYVNFVQRLAVYPQITRSLSPGIYSLLDTCDRYGVGCIQATMPAGLKEHFKAVYANYDKYYKFKGKV